MAGMRPRTSLAYFLWLVAAAMFTLYVTLRLLLPLAGVQVVDLF